ncbi:fidgetin-like protein 2 [Anguilla rostrata]|uniref:fidgetin-like protein 2 n=1 Tax=Anguilla rostrata TaxID=7938 RepID=UPI0030CA5D76
MLSPVVPYSLLKMHWTPEHAQSVRHWPEQHLDVSSTTSSPAHKPELHGGRGRSYSYAWANDDISALTASSLLKRYAEKYSGALDGPYDRAPMGGYPEAGPFGPLNGQKVELDPWPLSHAAEGPYTLAPPPGHESLGGGKVAGAGSAGVASNALSDPSYGSCGAPSTHDYAPAYNGTYLSSGYCPQPGTALPPTPLHPLQPAPTLVPSYTPPGPVYNYPSSSYPHQPSLAPSYTHAPAPYLPSSLAAPTPLPPRPTAVGGSYGYQGQGLGGVEPSGALKRKAFEMSAEEEEGEGSRYRKYGYEHAKPGGGSPYGVSEVKAECHSNGFGPASAGPQTFKPSKPPSQAAGEELGKFSGLKPLVSPPYGGVGEYSPPAGLTGENGGGDHGYPQHHLGPKLPAPCSQSGELLKGAEPHLLEVVTGELLDRSPAPPWAELGAGHAQAKAALEEDLLWPVLRPGPGRRPPRTVLLFGPRGSGKTALARGVASQLGAAFFRVSGAALASEWKGEADKLLRALFSAAAARQPAVVLVSQAEALADEGARRQLRSCLEAARAGPGAGPGGLLIAMCATRRPDLLEDATHRCFAKRYCVALPDAGGRRQVLLQALVPLGCRLSEREVAAVLQRTEGFSVPELQQLCQQASACASAPSPAPLHGLPAPLAPPAFKDFENAFCKVRPHATAKELDTCAEWSKLHGQ